MPERIPKLGEKTPLYPHGYGFCHCGCGMRTQPSPRNIYPMYLSKHWPPKKAQALKISQRKQNEITYKYHNTILSVETLVNEIDLLKNFVNDYWNTTDETKQLALQKLTWIVKTLKSLDRRKP